MEGAAPGDAAERCAGCGLMVAGGTEGCRAIFEELVARDFQDAAYFRTHRMLVDTYSLQHSERYCRSAKSLAAHLVGLLAILEHGVSPARGHERLRRWLDGNRRLDKPELPQDRGAITIAEVRAAGSPDAHAAAVERWARATWEAYGALHDRARAWYREAMGD